MSVSGADEPVTGRWAPLWGPGREVPSAGSCGHPASSEQLPDVLWLCPPMRSSHTPTSEHPAPAGRWAQTDHIGLKCHHAQQGPRRVTDEERVPEGGYLPKAALAGAPVCLAPGLAFSLDRVLP